MDRFRSRVVGVLVAHLGLVIVSLFVLDWYVAATPIGKLTFDLRSTHVCTDAGACDAFSLGETRGVGFYASLAGSTFWGTLLFSVLVIYQGMRRVTTGAANDSLSKIGYAAGLAVAGTAAAAGFLLGPQTTPDEQAASIVLTRTAAPFLLLLAIVLGIMVLYYAVIAAEAGGEYKPIPKLPPKPLSAPPPAVATTRPRRESVPPSVAFKKHSSSPPAAALVGAPPEHLRNKLKFATLTAELTRAGIDARREDGEAKLVMWSDVVGLVARRMPKELDGVTFVDVVSSAGATLRILPWTRLTGQPIDGEGDTWLRAVLVMMVARCGDAALDPATQRFRDGEPAAQLPDLAKLAAHDDKLA